MRPWPYPATGFNPGRINAAPTPILDSVPVGGALMRPGPDAATGFNPGRYQ